jgi:hypothetical protein
MTSPKTPNPPAAPVEKTVELPEEDTAANSDDVIHDSRHEEEEKMEGVENALELPEDVAASSGKLHDESEEAEGMENSEKAVERPKEKLPDNEDIGEEQMGNVVEQVVELPEERTAKSEKPFVYESEKEVEIEDDDSIGSLTVVKLKEECKKRGLKSGGRKAEIIQRIKDYDAAAENPVVESIASKLNPPPTKRGRGRPRKNPLYEALEEHNKVFAMETGSSISSSARTSARAKEPSSKIAPKLDTPISALTRHSDSDLEDDDDDETKSKESNTVSMTRQSIPSTAGQKSIPKAIVTRGMTKGATLPAVPEGDTFDDDEETSKPAAASNRRSTKASTTSATVTSSRRSTRAATESVASRVSRRSTKGKSKRFQ